MEYDLCFNDVWFKRYSPFWFVNTLKFCHQLSQGCNLFLQICPLFRQILIIRLKSSRASLLPSSYSKKLRWERGSGWMFTECLSYVSIVVMALLKPKDRMISGVFGEHGVWEHLKETAWYDICLKCMVDI